MQKNILLLLSLFAAGKITAQNVGIGWAAPSDKLHINSPAGVNPLRVQANGSTKLRVWENGGTGIGSLLTPPANGLLVQGAIQPQAGITGINKLIIECTSDSLIFNAGGSQVILSSNGNITIKAPAGKIVLEAAGDLELNGNNVRIQAGGLLTLNGTQIRLNGNARAAAGVGHQATGTAPAGGGTVVSTIVSGSSSVFIGN